MGGLAANRGAQQGGVIAAGAKDTAYVQGFGGLLQQPTSLAQTSRRSEDSSEKPKTSSLLTI